MELWYYVVLSHELYNKKFSSTQNRRRRGKFSDGIKILTLVLSSTNIYSSLETPFSFIKYTHKIFKYAILLSSRNIGIKQKFHPHHALSTPYYRSVQHQTHSSNLLAIDHRLQDYTQPSPVPNPSNSQSFPPSHSRSHPYRSVRDRVNRWTRPSTDPKINEADGREGLLRSSRY